MRSATRSTASRWCRASSARSFRRSTTSRPNGRAPARCGWSTARPPHPDKPFRTPAIAETYKRILAEAEAAGGDRVAQIEAARHAFYKGFVAEAIDRFYTHRTDGLDRRAPSRAAHRRRSRALRGARREAGCRSTITGSRCTSSGRGRRGRCCCRPCGCSKRIDIARDGPARAGVRAHAGRGAEARLRGSRDDLRRSRLRSTCRSRRCCRRPMRTSAAS